MSPSTYEPADRNHAPARARPASPRGDDLVEQRAAWRLEEIDAPDTWTLASFDDLLPREMV